MISILLIAWLVTVMPFFFWKSTWFGNRLSDQQTLQYLTDHEHPRKAQHALVQISERLSRGDASVHKFYPPVRALAESPVVELRMTAAWVMGQDNTDKNFHTALLRLRNDSEPMVRWNAALALVRFNDSTARSGLVEMLRPFTLGAPSRGIFRERLKVGDSVTRGTLLARIDPLGREEAIEIRSPVPGHIVSIHQAGGTSVSPGEPIFTFAPDEKDVWEALRGLLLVGEKEDLAEVERFARGVEGLSTRVQQQAQLSADAIRKRSAALQN